MAALTHGLPDGDGQSAPSILDYIDLRDVDGGENTGGGGTPSAGGGWQRWYLLALVGSDVVALVCGGLVALYARFGSFDQQVGGTPYLTVLLGGVLGWVATIAACRGYDPRFFGLGGEEFRRVGNAGVRFTALVALLAWVLDLALARGVVAVSLPLAWLLTLLLRFAARRVLHRLRTRGHACHRVLVVGEGPGGEALARRLKASPQAGLRVVGSYPVDPVNPVRSLDRIREALLAAGADTVAVAHSAGLTAQALRRLAWALEGADVDLLVAPAFTDVAGPRIHVRPVSGLPLLQLAVPEFTGTRLLVKRTMDVGGTLTLLLLLWPILVLTAVAVRLTSPGPALFSQTRIGQDGQPFTLYKFRSMTVDAEQRRGDLVRYHGVGSVLFKMHDDPRVTPIGRWLRRLSVDELPQLVNVLLGQMSLVGPRPPLPSEVAQYEDDVHRRLLVRPGMTGLWQVSGRADLSWSEAVRLDLYYVENWSVALDAEILWRTVFAVIRGAGAR